MTRLMAWLMGSSASERCCWCSEKSSQWGADERWLLLEATKKVGEGAK